MNDTTGASVFRGERSLAGDPNAQIAKKLRALYVSVQEEAIPDRFLDLLEKLDAAESKSAERMRNEA
ncbi:NepR family anti-sigma factor [Ensifer soli]|uniref:NepR family anti-sigma factor n=1 Tax=Ciceribacter sp. sgz301302 TaxID=3342379 RepID=UPI0035B8B1C7